MSHITHVDTEIRDREVLLRALERMGRSWEENLVVSHHGERRSMDIVLRDGPDRGVGFRRPGAGRPFRMYAWGVGPGVTQGFRQRVFQEYARLKLLEEARKRSFALVGETVGAGGQIRLVLRKVGQA